MITRFYAAVARHHRAILAVASAGSVGYLMIQLWVPALGQRAFWVMSAAIAVFLVLAVAAVAWRQPTAFVVQPHVPAFGAPAQPVFLFLALAFLTLATGTTGTVLRDWESDPFRPDQLIELGNAAVAILWIVVAWRDTSVQLRPDGLWQRGITGWLVVP